ncbi:MAG: acyl-CoA dehydrogenase C-terminal domain-containing protein, partial [Burkholderiaceae bacterium]|nr:acyl-CoA dehydrogenase C-terminal domain-containing protein [Burkholderiaceae bacterium]
RSTAAEARTGDVDLQAIGKRLAAAVDSYEAVVSYIVDEYKRDIRSAFAGSVPYLKLAGIVHGGWQMARAALVATRRIGEGSDGEFSRAKLATARFFADHMLVTVPSLAESITGGSVGTLALAEDQF